MKAMHLFAAFALAVPSSLPSAEAKSDKAAEREKKIRRTETVTGS